MTKSCALKGGQKVFQLHLDQAASCCRSYPTDISNIKSMDHLLQQWQHESLLLKQGTELKNCQHCWDSEKQGLTSYRQQLSDTWGDTNLIELFIDNTCNQMCSYCSPKFSSTWQKSIEERGVFQKISASAQKNLKTIVNSRNSLNWLKDINSYINQCEDDSVTLAIVGGEPLMQIRNLQQILTANQKKLNKLRITTNLNPPSSKFLHWVLDNFPQNKLTFLISLDTVPEYNSLPRAGFSQELFEENLNLLKLKNVEFSFLTVISVLNIFNLDKFQQWLKENRYHANFYRLNNPDCLDPSFLPQDTKNVLLNQNLPILAQQSLMYSPDSIDLKQFEQYNYLTQYFQRTDTKITDPEFSAYWTWLTQKFQ